MKVNFKEKQNEVYIYKLIVGGTFIARRKSADEMAIYMVIDKNSGVFLDSYKNKIMAVNLATGQVRPFDAGTKVKPIAAEVNLLD